ncbi:MAG: hypothetical protein GXO54_07405 [Chloroflexi bacterium]|nr:hypothetical protein [Chloroflexota bacterium]
MPAKAAPATPDVGADEDVPSTAIDDAGPSLPPEAIEAGLLAWRAEAWEQWMTTHAPDAGLVRAARWLVYVVWFFALLASVLAIIALFAMT